MQVLEEIETLHLEELFILQVRAVAPHSRALLSFEKIERNSSKLHLLLTSQ
jgi:hypothetical protein